MPPRRPIRRCLITFLVMASVLFSQLALASYICPGMQEAAEMAEMMIAGTPCDGMDTDQPVLCHQHAAGASLSYEQVKVAAPLLPVVIQLLVVPWVLESASLGVPRQSEAAQRPPPDPVFLSTHRLRV